MSDQKYVFFKSREGGKSERIEKTEDELTKEEKDLIYGNLINTWNNCPKEIQMKFMQECISIAGEDFELRFQSTRNAFEERIELDARITDMVNEWRKDRSGTELFHTMMKVLHKNYSYVEITTVGGPFKQPTLYVKIHDGLQTFN